MHAYDIELLKYSTPAAGEELQGWCFGLPPGITPEQWPLDPDTGYPLMHGFTLRLPEDYRVHGPEIVALSFFSLSPDQNDGGPNSVDGIAEQLVSPGEQPPADPDLLPFWQAGRASHPRLHRMEDILGGAYAVILLTEAEFNGAACQPPRLPAGNPLLAQTAAPQWLASGSASTFDTTMKEGDYLFGLFGGIPQPGLETRYLLRWSPRASDPNAGIQPDEYGGTDYQLFYYWENDDIHRDNYREHAWSQGHQPNHIGGTMRPVQGMPDVSAYYIGFEEYLGGYNFGTGNAQLDFRDMKIDWAC
ncbi:hypothetical protein ACQCLI_20220 [Pseudomonas nitroreducens]|uniref:hypothetical protein n=1 Tax=Pseudomonas TaxID=286 RepID=UPI00030E937A|nr:hypothetical protein [Pseudomonas nitroreducens]